MEIMSTGVRRVDPLGFNLEKTWPNTVMGRSYVQSIGALDERPPIRLDTAVGG